MDMQKLVTFGKITRTLVISEYTFSLATPIMNDISASNDTQSNLVQFVTAINGEDFTSPAAKEQLKATLQQTQAGVVAALATACNEMAEEQNKLIKGMVSGGKA